MVNLQVALDDCLRQLAGGSLSVEECLARYPQHAAALRPLLQTAARLETVTVSQPSAAFRARGRRELLAHMRAHPRAEVSARRRLALLLGRAASGLAARPAYALVVLVVVLLLGVTTAAQAALPGQSLYGWKRASEQVWRAVHPDPLGAELALVERRAGEWIRVVGDPQAEPLARAAYEGAMQQLGRHEQEAARVRIAAALAEQALRLRAAGVEPPSPPPDLPAVAPPTPLQPPGTATTAPTRATEVAPTATRDRPLPTPSSTSTASDRPAPANTPQPSATRPSLPLPETMPTATPLPTTTPLPTATPQPALPTLQITLPAPTLEPTLAPLPDPSTLETP